MKREILKMAQDALNSLPILELAVYNKQLMSHFAVSAYISNG